MLKEKFENAKNFVKEHKTEILIGTISIGTLAFLGYKLNTKEKEFLKVVQEKAKTDDLMKIYSTRVTDLEIAMDTMYDMFIRNLGREETRIVFEMEALKEYINNLDKTIKINQIVNIPNAEKRLNELGIQLKELMTDKNKADEIVKYFIH